MEESNTVFLILGYPVMRPEPAFYRATGGFGLSGLHRAVAGARGREGSEPCHEESGGRVRRRKRKKKKKKKAMVSGRPSNGMG